jgi:2-amino-1-hydroxyethylphosphonate dioxygenase (glycine-forming)
MEKPFQIYKEHGRRGYIGESVSQLEHATQTGLLAEKYCDENNISGFFKNDLIISAFLHDIGHLLVFEYPCNEYPLMDNLGVKDHEFIGGEFLLSLGYSRVIAELVKGHVYTKRYLISKKNDYYDNLSYTSKETFKHQGGLLNNNEIINYEKNYLFQYHLKIREWDDMAKSTEPHLLKKIKDMNPTKYFYEKYVL